MVAAASKARTRRRMHPAWENLKLKEGGVDGKLVMDEAVEEELVNKCKECGEELLCPKHGQKHIWRYHLEPSGLTLYVCRPCAYLELDEDEKRAEYVEFDPESGFEAGNILHSHTQSRGGGGKKKGEGEGKGETVTGGVGDI